MNRNRNRMTRVRRVSLTAIAGAALAVSVTACGSGGGGKADAAADSANSSAEAAASDTSGGTTPQNEATPDGSAGDGRQAEAPSSGNGNGSGKGAAGADTGNGNGSDGTDGGKKGYGQTCGANDLSFSARSESQAGGYILVSAKAKPGITCTIPSGLPGIAFGSGGIEADPAEQVAGDQVILSGSRTVYAGVNPKSTNNNDGTEFTSLIVSIGKADPNPAGVPTGSVTVDRPLVTNWHTDPSQAVPGDGDGTDK